MCITGVLCIHGSCGEPPIFSLPIPSNTYHTNSGGTKEGKACLNRATRQPGSRGRGEQLQQTLQVNYIRANPSELHPNQENG